MTNHSTMAARSLRTSFLALVLMALGGAGKVTAAHYDNGNGSANGFWANNANWTPDAANEYPGGPFVVGLISNGPTPVNPVSTNDLLGESFDGVLIYGSAMTFAAMPFGLSPD